MPYPQPPHPGYRLSKPVILKMEPLTETEGRRVRGKFLQGQLRRPVFAQQTHVKVPVVRGALRLLMARGRGPSLRQIVQAVPMDAWADARQKARRSCHAPSLHLLGAKGGNPHLSHPDR